MESNHRCQRCRCNHSTLQNCDRTTLNELARQRAAQMFRNSQVQMFRNAQEQTDNNFVIILGNHTVSLSIQGNTFHVKIEKNLFGTKTTVFEKTFVSKNNQRRQQRRQ